MKRLVIVLFLAAMLSPLFSQNTSNFELLNKIDELKLPDELEKYDSLSKILYQQVKKNDKNHDEAIYARASYYFHKTFELLLEEKYKELITANNEFDQLYNAHYKTVPKEFIYYKLIILENYITAYNILKEYKTAQKYKKSLYKLHKANPILDDYRNFFRFDYFKLDGKNVWAYEWFEELPKDRFSTSFSKVVYYVYDTDEEGRDSDTYYMLRVLMFHKMKGTADFDYILTKEKINKDENILYAGSYYSYTYMKKIDYQKLRKDVIEVISKKIEPDTRRQTKLQ